MTKTAANGGSGHGEGSIAVNDAAVYELLISLSRAETAGIQRALEAAMDAVTRAPTASTRADDPSSGSSSDEKDGGEAQYQPPPGIVNRPDGQKVLFRPFTSPRAVGAKLVVHAAPSPERGGGAEPLHGAVVVLDPAGRPRGLLGAEELTGFRTALSALGPLARRLAVGRVVVFGAGKQALWHARLALRLRGAEVEEVVVVCRGGRGSSSQRRAEELVATVERECALYGWREEGEKPLRMTVASAQDDDVPALLRAADVVCCTVGSTSPLFSLADLMGDQAGGGGDGDGDGGLQGAAAAAAATGSRTAPPPLVTAVGSWQAGMIELDPALVRHAARASRSTTTTTGTGASGEGGAALFMVDDRAESLVKTGECVQSGLAADEVLQLGEVLRRLGEEEGVEGSPSEGKGGGGLRAAVESGLVVYKVVGVSATDLAAAGEILRLAGEKGVGLPIPGF